MGIKSINSINNKTNKGKKRYYQGFYKLKNKDKYIGDPNKIIYRSKWEFYSFVWADDNTSIRKWSSEHITITYADENGKIHRYYPDLYIEKIDKSDPELLEKIIIEIKPLKEIKPDFVTEDGKILPPDRYLKKLTPKSLESYEYQLKTYQKNLYKWTKAIYWCNQRHMKFIIMHEGHLKRYNIM